MVRAVEIFEQPGMMHRPVRPVEIGVVRDDYRRKQRKVGPQPYAFTYEVMEYAMLFPPDQETGTDDIDQGGLQRLEKFAAHIGCRGFSCLYLARLDRSPAQQPDHCKSDRSCDQVPSEIERKNMLALADQYVEGRKTAIHDQILWQLIATNCLIAGPFSAFFRNAASRF
jgi:hypothetical protein